MSFPGRSIAESSALSPLAQRRTMRSRSLTTASRSESMPCFTAQTCASLQARGMRTGMQEGERHLNDAALAQLYRGEVGRSDRWRSRLDTTTNWALTTTAAVISFGFGSASTSHVPLLVGLWMVLTFLFIEARRYRYYDLWNRRLRLLEDGYWAPLLRGEPVDPDAMRELALELERPTLQLSLFAALQTRLQRAYGSLVVVLFCTW